MARGGSRAGSGRPKGSKDMEWREMLASRAPAAVGKLIELAVGDEPNVQALRMILDRTIAPLKAISPPVTFDLSGDTPAQQAQSIVRAAADGRLSPSTAVELLNALSSCAKIMETTELLERLEALEKQHK